MSGKDNHDSIASKEDSELKNPGRRQVLGVAAAAAAFTAGQVGSAAAEGKKKPPAKKPAPGRHGGLVNPADLPGEHKLGQDGYLPVTKFQDLAAQQVYADAADYRQKVSAYAKSLRQKMNLPDSEFTHVIRLQLKMQPGQMCPPDCCACCCS